MYFCKETHRAVWGLEGVGVRKRENVRSQELVALTRSGSLDGVNIREWARRGEAWKREEGGSGGRGDSC